MSTMNRVYKSVVNFTRFTFAMVFLAVLTSASAFAQGPCTPVNAAPPTDPGLLVFEVEGRINSFDRTNRTITVNGMTFHIPSTVLVETRNLDLNGNITFEYLTDAALEAQHSIIGGTVIASGDITFSPSGSGYCMSYSATRVYVEFAEHVIVGLLSDVNATAGTFRVNGSTIFMNNDPRFPNQVLDAGGNEITINDLVGFEGTQVTVNGCYMDSVVGFMGTIIETEIIKAQPGVDGVAIMRAEARVGNRELRVEGANTVSPATGQYAANVEVFAGGLNAAGDGCASTTRLGTPATVSTLDGSWSFRLRNINTFPSQVCVKSPLGGVATRAVTQN